jgi:glycosyltransferase involved in cell wall biosynthesis
MRPRIFFVHSGNETFVQLDRDLLSGFADVQDFHASQKFPLGLLDYWRGIRKSNLVFCWFASWNSFWALLLARLFHKPSILAIGGYDIANLPEADYGHQRGGLGKWVSRLAMRLATQLFTNSYYSQKEAEQNAGVSLQRVKVIYHGVPDPFGSLPQTPKERMALTVGKVDFPNLKRKGLQAFVEAAAFLPDVQFVLVGEWADKAIEHLRMMASANVLFTGRVTEAELLDYYRKASVYVQASLHEGFGLSVAEAMLAGCIPVVTQAGALPEVVGDCGLYCNLIFPESIVQMIRDALNFSACLRAKARDRVLKEFPLGQRKQSLKQVYDLKEIK